MPYDHYTMFLARVNEKNEKARQTKKQGECLKILDEKRGKTARLV